MTTTITLGATVVTPTMVLGYESEREHGNQARDIQDSNEPDIDFKEAGLRSGTLDLFCNTHALALSVEALHCNVGVFTLASSELPGIDMDYVPLGRVRSKLDPDTARRWIVSVDFQEVS